MRGQPRGLRLRYIRGNISSLAKIQEQRCLSLRLLDRGLHLRQRIVDEGTIVVTRTGAEENSVRQISECPLGRSGLYRGTRVTGRIPRHRQRRSGKRAADGTASNWGQRSRNARSHLAPSVYSTMCFKESERCRATLMRRCASWPRVITTAPSDCDAATLSNRPIQRWVSSGAVPISPVSRRRNLVRYTPGGSSDTETYPLFR